MKKYFLTIALLAGILCTAQELTEDEIYQRYDLSGLTIEGTVKLKPGDKIRLDNLNFYGGTTQLLPESEPVLQDLLKIMQDNPALKIEIQGHICCYPDKRHEISNARAQVVWRYLKNNDIAKNRISYKDFGGTQPLYPIPEETPAQREMNRRVEVKVLSN